MENASFGKIGFKNKTRSPKMSVQEIVGLMFVTVKLFLPTSAAPAIARSVSLNQSLYRHLQPES